MTLYRITYEETELREVLVDAADAAEARHIVESFEHDLANSSLIETVHTDVLTVEVES